MKTKLDRLLEAIDPEKIIEQTYHRANEAINSFRYKKAKIDKWNEFRSCMAEFLRHLDQGILNLSQPVDAPTDFYWGQSVQPLLKIYGINGEKAAFEMARTGNEGGMYAVLKAFAMQKCEEYSQSEISAKVLAYWNNLPVDEKFKTMDEYLQKYGHLFPAELTEKNAVRLRANFWKVLEKHPHMVQNLRRSPR